MSGAPFLLAVALSLAQQPAKPPEIPAINPALARLDATLGGLDGPGFAVAADEDAGLLAAGCERGAIPYWNKDVSMGVRAGTSLVHSMSGHQGPVLALV